MDHAEDGDAQEVYRKLIEHHLRSTKAMFDASSTLSYLTSAKMGSGSWTGSNEGFLEN